jgi:hypothetical protein
VDHTDPNDTPDPIPAVHVEIHGPHDNAHAP